MRYFVNYNELGKVIAVGTGYGGLEITEEEYNEILHEIREKTDLANKLYYKEITISDIPAEWQEEIQRRVDERIESEGAVDEHEISAEEALYIILGGD